MCHDAQAEFAAFANDRHFRAAHPSPLPTAATNEGEFVTFPVADGVNGRAYMVKASKPTKKYLLLFQEWWGVNSYIKNEAAYWAKTLDMNVLAPDLYDGKVATTPEEAGKLMQSNNAERSKAIIAGAVQYAGPKANFRTMGWCFGGGWSLKAALQLKKAAKACVMYYGMPEKDIALLKTLKTDVIFIHATQDKWINDNVVADFEKNMAKAGQKLQVYRYNSDHAFANPSSPRYNEAAANEARKVVTAYLLR